MMHILIIACFAAVYLRDGLEAPVLWRWLGPWSGASPGIVAACSMGSLAGVWASSHLVIRRLGRRLDRRGSYRDAQRAEVVLLISRLAAVGLHSFNVLALGWLDAVRQATGNLVGVDEVMACVPVLLVVALGWYSLYPVDRRLRESLVIGALDEGRSLPPMLTRWQYIAGALRHQVLWVVIPITSIMSWGEQTDRWVQQGELGSLEAGAAQVAGIAALLVVMPAVMRRLWDTVSLGPGSLRDRLEAMCRDQGIRVRDLLVWRTHGTMINGAVMGFVPRFRYILLTDALIEHLPMHQVEAVMAHELGHVRRHHILWLGASALGSITVVSWVALVGMELARPGLASEEWAQGVAGAASLGVGLLVFGLVSRRFEWQADAFAVQHMSGLSRRAKGAVEVTPEAVEAMRGALESVARLNHIPRHRFTWRHGSIAARQQRLEALAGQRADRLPIDRLGRRIAVVSAVVGLVAAGLVVWSGVSSARGGTGRGHGSLGMEVDGAICQDARDRE